MLGWTLDSFDFTIFLLIMLPIAQESNLRLTDVTFVFRPAGLVDSLLGAYKRHPPNLLLAAAVDPSRWSLGSSPNPKGEALGIEIVHDACVAVGLPLLVAYCRLTPDYRAWPRTLTSRMKRRSRFSIC